MLNIIIKKLFGMHGLLLLYCFNKEEPEIIVCDATGHVNFSSHELFLCCVFFRDFFFFINRWIQIIQIYAFERTNF